MHRHSLKGIDFVILDMFFYLFEWAVRTTRDALHVHCTWLGQKPIHIIFAFVQPELS